MSNYFPSELITDIVSQLPVKSLLRFKSVSKPWRSLIEEPDFIKSYIKRSTETNTNLSLIINDGGALHWVAIDSLDHATELEYPLKHHNDHIKVLCGSRNGWVCIVNSKQDIILWNMSTKENHIVVPYKPNESHYVAYKKLSAAPTYGFGYDSINDDYKVLKIQQFVSKDYTSFKCKAMVYSVKRNSWRKTKDLPCYIDFLQVGLHSGGALHWVAATEPSASVPGFIIAFDVGTEEYSKVPLPEGMGFRHNLTVGVLGECLCVTKSDQVGVDIWVMKDYMVKKPWTKLISVVSHKYNNLKEDFPCGNLMPLAYSRSGDKVLLEDVLGNLLWYHLIEKKFKEIKIPGLNPYRQGTCLGSLIPLSVNRN